MLSLLGGLDIPSEGKILFQGEDIVEKGFAWHRKNNVALTSKLPPLPILERVGLTKEESNRNVLKLSGGQQQRVAIARAVVASDANVILADKPTGNLDEDTALDITNILKKCAHETNKCVIIVTHSNDLVKQVDEVFCLKKGELQKLRY